MCAAMSVSLHALQGVPLVEPGDDLAGILIEALRENGLDLVDGDILVLAQKIVSKADGLYVDLDAVEPSDEAQALASRLGKDARHVEVVLRESNEIVKVGQHVIVTEQRLGFVMANSGIDESNISHDSGSRVLLLPRDPDASAAQLKARLDAAFGANVGVVINDSFGRPWRNGVVGVAIGAAGVPSLVDRVGSTDLFGRTLKVTEIAMADELASAASLLMGQADEGKPVVLIRGVRSSAPDAPARALIRSRERDMFR
jgi:coenzyme F420-0:L-glutamate ligase/coenzyme F420-1:gamma-L-glutamate ligase